MAHQHFSHLSSCMGRCGPHMEIPYLCRIKCRPHSHRPSSAGLSSCKLVVLCFCSFWEKPSFGRCSFNVLRTGLCRPCSCHKVISIRRPLCIFCSLSAVLLYLCSQGHLRIRESSISDKCPKRRPRHGYCTSSSVNRSYCKPISLRQLFISEFLKKLPRSTSSCGLTSQFSGRDTCIMLVCRRKGHGHFGRSEE